jgi:hypothetical protein
LVFDGDFSREDGTIVNINQLALNENGVFFHLV